MNELALLFRRKTAASTASDQLYEADRLYLEHQAAGEMHAGLAGIYKLRADRLRQHEIYTNIPSPRHSNASLSSAAS